MMDNAAKLALEAFQRAAQRVPAYRTLLAEAGIQTPAITEVSHFSQLPILEKSATFQRFEIAQLCLDGELGPLASVLTSSGHSGIFAFGLTSRGTMPTAAEWTDGLLDELFQVRSKPTLLINCLPMGVKVSTQACTLAETSVRPDMAVGLVRAFGQHYAQIILVGETGFIKHLLELGAQAGVDWKRFLVHVIVGEEPLAENGRKYLEHLLGSSFRETKGIIVSSMGVGEIGLNLFFEAPPGTALISLRRWLHENPAQREAILGASDWVPCLFTYDPRRIFVEFDAAGRLVLTTLDPGLRLPLIRYATGDHGRFIRVPAELRPALEAAGISWELLQAVPIVAIEGRGSHALAGQLPVYPEAVKEGIYHDLTLAALTTVNFRLVSGPERARVRIQLSPGVKPDAELPQKFKVAISHYVRAPLDVTCEAYESFGDGMTLDYERKFPYLGR